ncbi:MAG: hypothetical protein KAS32_29935 [Candidatus Peribacteraceae bacterium]|nr:hypothetical protein [Candidatus Peribacteraceae bacterium]
MNDDELLKIWIDFLQNRLNHYESQFNFIMSTLIAMIGLSMAILGTSISLSSESLFIKLISSIIISAGIIIVMAIGRSITKHNVKKRKRILSLLHGIIAGQISDTIQIDRAWKKISTK